MAVASFSITQLTAKLLKTVQQLCAEHVKELVKWVEFKFPRSRPNTQRQYLKTRLKGSPAKILELDTTAHVLWRSWHVLAQ